MALILEVLPRQPEQRGDASMRLLHQAVLLALAALLGTFLSAVTEATAPTPRLDGAYIYLPFLAGAPVETAALMGELRAWGADTIVTSELSVKVNCADAAYDDAAADALGTLRTVLDEAALGGIGVYVGLVFSQGTCAPESGTTALHDAAEAARLIDLIGAHPAIRGWSVVNEPALAWEARADLIAGRNAYDRAQVDAIRSRSPLPVVTAPYLGVRSTPRMGPSTARSAWPPTPTPSSPPRG